MMNWINSYLKRLGEFRDSLLVVAGGLYILGYVVRSINGFTNNLGFLPAFESQYLIAGIIPAIVIFVFYLLILLTWRIKIGFSNWIDSGSYKIVIPLLIIVMYLISAGVTVYFNRVSDERLMTAAKINLASGYLLFGMIFIKFSTIENARKSLFSKNLSWHLRLYFLLILLITIPYYLFVILVDKIITGTGEQIKEIMDPLTMFTIVFVTLYTVSGLWYFVSDIYPQIPQEFGGARPRCAFIDVTGNEISSEIREALFFPDNKTNTNVVRSIQVDVYFSSSEFILVKPHNRTLQSETITYELQKSIVQSVIWCK